ncbi:MAG: tetratricopeptide repeat protein [Deltaproteobacteria bacterium]|nr:tetratricopeptide repeat protein [Deltaproteobacteria bacterium]
MNQNHQTTDEIFSSAMAAYQTGQLTIAESLLADLIRMAPEYTEALYALSVICHQLGKSDSALIHIRNAININEAESKYHHFLGILENLKGNHREAAAAFEKALRLQPENADLAYNLGNAFKAQGSYEAAVSNYRKAIFFKADFLDAHYNLGNVYQEQGDYGRARACFESSLKIQPDFVKAHHNLGVLLKRMGDVRGAERHFRAVIKLQPGFAEAHNNLGNILLSDGRLHEAVNCFKRAVGIRQDYPQAHYNLGVAFNRMADFETAKAAFETAVRQDPGFVEAHHNLGVALQNLGEAQEAICAFNKVLTLKPDFVEALWNRSLARLLSGDLPGGFKDYEARFHKLDHSRIYPGAFSTPRWEGEPFQGKRLLVHYEQEFGDTLQFVRYLPKVKSHGGTVILEVQGELHELMKRVGGVDLLIDGKKTPGPQVPCDYHVPLLSLPGIFQTRIEDIPRKIPYVFPDPQKSEYWKKQLSDEKGLKVGIVWAGNLSDEKGRHRSCSLEYFVPLGSLASIRFYGLQKGDAAGEIDTAYPSFRATNLSERLTDFSETCAVIDNLDLIISVDTAVAHLAGAMGKATFVLLSKPCDWRWLLDRDDSPWYPSIKLFRQPRQGDWDSVFARVHSEIKTIIESKTLKP